MTAAPAGRPTGRVGWRPFSGDPAVASVRLRTLLPVSALRDAGWDVTVLDDGDGAEDRDCVVFQKAYQDADLALAERTKERGARVVVDLCDNHLWVPDDRPELRERADRLRRLLALADHVTVSTRSLQEALGWPGTVVPDAIEIPRGVVASRARQRLRRTTKRRGGPLRLVWFGNAGSDSPPFGLIHLGQLVPVLAEVHRDSTPLRLTVLSNDRDTFSRHVGRPGFPVRYRPWRRTTWAWHVAGHDACILPVEPNPFTMGKTANRAESALLLGVPVVAGDIPAYRALEPHLAIEDWARNLVSIDREPDVWHRRADDGTEAVAAASDPSRVAARWADVLRDVLGGVDG